MKIRTTAIALLIAAVFAHEAGAARWYVNAANGAAGNGKTWLAAFTTLTAALSAASGGDEIWVAAGVYKGGFTVQANVTLLGGFRTGDADAAVRRPLVNRSVLDGGGTMRVLVLNNGSVVDGFIVQNGRAGSPGGGGVLINGTSPTVRNTVFQNNRNTGGRGSAAYINNGAKPVFHSCLFTKNAGSGHVIDVDGAGGIYAHIVVDDNVSNGLHFQGGSTPAIYNSAFTRNTGRGICHISATDKPIVENNLFDGNAISHFHYRGTELKSIAAINNLSYAKGNIGGAPGFYNPAALDYAPNPASPLIDQGRDGTGFPVLDLLLRPRYDDPGRSGPTGYRDIGAVEWQGCRLTQGGTPSPGQTVSLLLAAPNDGGLSYQAAASLTSGSIPVDTRSIHIGFDAFVVVSLLGYLPGVFADFTGKLNASGNATAAIHVPNEKALKGIAFQIVFVTLNGSSPSGIKSIAETIAVTIQ